MLWIAAIKHDAVFHAVDLHTFISTLKGKNIINIQYRAQKYPRSTTPLLSEEFNFLR